MNKDIWKQIKSGKNYKAINIGNFDELEQYEFIHPKFGTKDPARIFVGELLETTGSELSVRKLAPGTTIPFLHKHHKNEEVYIFLNGSGQFCVDGDIFQVSEGSIIKVATDGSRSLKNDSDEFMIYMVIQALEGSLQQYNVLDGYRVAGEVKL